MVTTKNVATAKRIGDIEYSIYNYINITLIAMHKHNKKLFCI